MASALPQPSRPSTDPPAVSVPPLPAPKSRKSLPVPSDTSRASSPAQASSKLRTPSSPRPTLSKSPLSNSTTNISAARSASNGGRAPSSPDKSLRRTISIAAFPQPPKAGSRPSTASSLSNMHGINSSGSVKARKGSRLSSGTTSSYRSSKTPSLLNGSGDGKSILSTDPRDPEASPSQSRSSSAQGSYSTSATTYEEAEDATGASKAGAKAKESKGNVLVSVRVRPDASGSDTSKSGEWGLDGRRGLISYKGKEGGEYHYGMVALCFEGEIFHRDEPKGQK